VSGGIGGWFPEAMAASQRTNFGQVPSQCPLVSEGERSHPAQPKDIKSDGPSPRIYGGERAVLKESGKLEKKRRTFYKSQRVFCASRDGRLGKLLVNCGAIRG